MESCVFCKIIKGEIPAEFVYQDEEIAVFPSNDPKAPVHLLLISKTHIEDFIDAPLELIGKLKAKATEIINEQGLLQKGYRFGVNGGTAKAINHLHFHLLGGITKNREI